MQLPRRFLLPSGLLVFLAILGVLGSSYKGMDRKRATRGAAVEISVISGDDRGPGSLREALFTSDAAGGKAGIVIRVRRIDLRTPLPPLVNPHGISITATDPAATIDAHQLGSGPVFDVDGADSSIAGFVIRGCPASAILVRATNFALKSTTIASCDVGIEVAENAADIKVQGNVLLDDRIGVRFAGADGDASVTANRFTGDTHAGIWAVRGALDRGTDSPIVVRDNRFQDDRIGVVAGNIAIVIDHNIFTGALEAALHLIGAGAVVTNNRISGGVAMGIVAENTRGAKIVGNELDHVGAYAVFVRGSSGTLIKGNRISGGGYGMAFVLGESGNPNTAVGNAILGQKYDGIDVLGESPVLRENQVLQARAVPIKSEDFVAPGGARTMAHPFMDNNVVSSADTAHTQLATQPTSRLGTGAIPR